MPAGSADALAVAAPLAEHSQRTVTGVSNLVLYPGGALQHWQRLPRELACAIDPLNRMFTSSSWPTSSESRSACVLATGLDSHSRPQFAHPPRKGVLLRLLAARLRAVSVRVSDCYRATYTKSAGILLFLHIEWPNTPTSMCKIRIALFLTCNRALRRLRSNARMKF